MALLAVRKIMFRCYTIVVIFGRDRMWQVPVAGRNRG